MVTTRAPKLYTSLCFAHFLAYFAVHWSNFMQKFLKYNQRYSIRESIVHTHFLPSLIFDCPRLPKLYITQLLLHPFPPCADKTSDTIDCISVYLSIYFSIHLSIYLSIYLYIYLSICSFVCSLFIYWSIHQYIILSFCWTMGDDPTTTLKFSKISPPNHNHFH